MATKSFTRTIIVSDKKAVERLKNIACSESLESNVSSLVNKHRDIINKRTDSSTIKNILTSY